MYAQKFKVDVMIRGERRACPLEWLDQFCMRNFDLVFAGRTEAAIAALYAHLTAWPRDALVVASAASLFHLTPERFAEGLAAWLNQRGKGEGQLLVVQVTRE
jgi:hypothetical protein